MPSTVSPPTSSRTSGWCTAPAPDPRVRAG
jgi:hypothetical protein